MHKKKNNKKEIPATTTAFIGAALLLVGGFFLFYNYIESKKIIAYDYMANVFYKNNEVSDVEIASGEEKKEEPIEEEQVEEELPEEVTDEYIGYLTIPKIGLNKGFLDKRSTENDVEKNIMVLTGSNYPNVKNGNLIIAGHSGTGWKAALPSRSGPGG